MTLAQLRYLLAIIDSGLNITGAAEQVNATQSGLSKQLKQLESDLGLKLFARRGRNLDCLTSAGEEIVERARIIISESNNIQALAANQRKAARGSLHLETTSIQAQFVLPAALAALRGRYPEIDVTLGLGADAEETTRRGAPADLALFSTDGRRPAAAAAFPLYRWDPVAIVPPDHPLAVSEAPLTLAVLASHPLITYDTSRVAPLSIARTFLEAGLAPRFAYTVREPAIIKASVRGGLGVGLIAEMAVDPARDDDLRVLPLAGLLPRCTAWAVVPLDRILRDPAAHLVSLLSGLTPRAVQRRVSGDAEPGAPEPPPMWPAFALKRFC